MSTLLPFRALRSSPEQVSKVAAVPYDVVNKKEAAELASGQPLSFLHVSRPEIDLPEGTDPHSDIVYQTAAKNFQALIQSAPLTQEAEPCFYIYRLQTAQKHWQIGIAGIFSVEEYQQNIIKKHEKTRADKEDDRTKHILTLRAQTGPVFLTYEGKDSINDFVAQVVQTQKPLYDFIAPDGVTHTVWRVAETRSIIEMFKSVKYLYIADGHHRAAAAARVAQELKSDVSRHFYAVAFPAEQLRILPYHRLLKDLNQYTPEKLLTMLQGRFEVKPNASAIPAVAGEFAMYLQGKWWGIKPKHKAAGLVGALDVSVLQDQILRPIFGITDPRKDSRIDFVGGVRGTKELEKIVDSGGAQVAFSMYPTSLQEMIRIADAGEIMPPKSTWFEPKLRDGILSYLLK